MIFSRKLIKSFYPKIVFNKTPVFHANWQKHLGMCLDKALNFSHHIPHLGYGDIIYDQRNNERRIQHNPALVVTDAIQETSRSMLYSKIDLESLKFRCWFRKLCIVYKIKETCVPGYLFDHILQTDHLYNTRSSEDDRTFYRRTDVSKYFFFIYNGISSIRTYDHQNLCCSFEVL